jgi:hypothetical protein
MKQRALIKISVFTAVAMALYVASYGLLRCVRPEIINTNDGPIQSFRTIYYPLRFLDADRPDYFSAAKSGWLKVKIDWINPGNGYLYFTWNSLERRAGVRSSIPDFHEGTLAGLHEDEEVWIHFTHQLVTWDDFRSRMIPLIDQIQKEL